MSAYRDREQYKFLSRVYAFERCGSIGFDRQDSGLRTRGYRMKGNPQNVPALQFDQVDFLCFNLPNSYRAHAARVVQWHVLRPSQVGLTGSLPSVKLLALRNKR